MAAAPGLSYVMQTYRMVFKYDNAQRRRFEPMAAAIGYDWNDLGESLAEIVTVAHPTHSAKGRLIAESFQSDPLGQLLNHIGVRLRQGGSRQPITRAQDGSRFVKMPKGAASLAGEGGEDEEVLPMRARAGSGVPRAAESSSMPPVRDHCAEEYLSSLDLVHSLASSPYHPST